MKSIWLQCLRRWWSAWCSWEERRHGSHQVRVPELADQRPTDQTSPCYKWPATSHQWCPSHNSHKHRIKLHNWHKWPKDYGSVTSITWASSTTLSLMSRGCELTRQRCLLAVDRNTRDSNTDTEKRCDVKPRMKTAMLRYIGQLNLPSVQVQFGLLKNRPQHITSASRRPKSIIASRWNRNSAFQCLGRT